uniref:Ig-like domain-containing protein n=1 Tax=Poecilia formosa TaxID=48698 RepID=A0A096M6X1_POEFO
MKFTGCLGIMVSSLILFVVCSLTFFSCVSSCDYSCPDKPVITPSRLVVKFGDPASATCVACQQACLPLDDSVISMEASLGTPDVNGTIVTWTVDRMTEWELTPKCYYSDSANHQCCTGLSVTVYSKLINVAKHFRELSLSIVVTIEVFYVLHFQHECCCLMLLIVTIISIFILFSSPEPPETVSFSLNPSEPLTEGSKVTLQCDVLNVAPVANLIVTFYRGQTPLGQVKSNDATEEPVSETFSLSYNTRKEDDGVQFWCEAKLELGAEGPQPPLVVKSEEVTATVYCKFRDTHVQHILKFTENDIYSLNQITDTH